VASFDVKAASSKHFKIPFAVLEMDEDEFSGFMRAEKASPMSLPTLIKARKEWRSLGVLTRKVERRFENSVRDLMPKLRSFWIWGDSDAMKTRSLDLGLAAVDPDEIYRLPDNNDWVGYAGQRILVFEDFRGVFSPSHLCRIADGDVLINIKGQPSVTVPKDPVLFVTSSEDIDHVFKQWNPSSQELASIRNRFAFIHASLDGTRVPVFRARVRSFLIDRSAMAFLS